MEAYDKLNQKLKIKQTELNYTTEPKERKLIEKSINILRLKLEIEKIRDRIKYLNQR